MARAVGSTVPVLDDGVDERPFVQQEQRRARRVAERRSGLPRRAARRGLEVAHRLLAPVFVLVRVVNVAVVVTILAHAHQGRAQHGPPRRRIEQCDAEAHARGERERLRLDTHDLRRGWRREARCGRALAAIVLGRRRRVLLEFDGNILPAVVEVLATIEPAAARVCDSVLDQGRAHLFGRRLFGASERQWALAQVPDRDAP